ncbi:hypothetical protein B0T13DRAFT_480060, partial [Neurospora crassa]
MALLRWLRRSVHLVVVNSMFECAYGQKMVYDTKYSMIVAEIQDSICQAWCLRYWRSGSEKVQQVAGPTQSDWNRAQSDYLSWSAILSDGEQGRNNQHSSGMFFFVGSFFGFFFLSFLS